MPLTAWAEFAEDRGRKMTAEEERDSLRETLKREAALTVRLIHERDEARRALAELNDAAADLVAEAVGPYDPPQRGSNLEKLYRLVRRP